MSNLTTLRSLNISGNAIGASGAVALGASLCHLTALRSLNINVSAIGDVGAEAL